MDKALRKAARLLRQSGHAFALTGAGLSVASGIPDFRSPGGLWSRHDPMSPDGKLVAFTKQLGGVHKVFVYDLTTGQETQVTSGGGSDENPSFSPDSYFIAFSSTRSGQRKIYVTTRHGTPPVMTLSPR